MNFADLFPTTSTTPAHQKTGAIIQLASELNLSGLESATSYAAQTSYHGLAYALIVQSGAAEAVISAIYAKDAV